MSVNAKLLKDYNGQKAGTKVLLLEWKYRQLVDMGIVEGIDEPAEDWSIFYDKINEEEE
jgi:hypothetical protein